MLPQISISPPPPKTQSKLDTASNADCVKNCNRTIRLKQRVWKALLCYLNSREVSQAVGNKIALLKGIKKQNSYAYLQRKAILDRNIAPKDREKAHKLLIEACNELIGDLSKSLGGAA